MIKSFNRLFHIKGQSDTSKEKIKAENYMLASMIKTKRHGILGGCRGEELLGWGIKTHQNTKYQLIYNIGFER